LCRYAPAQASRATGLRSARQHCLHMQNLDHKLNMRDHVTQLFTINQCKNADVVVEMLHHSPIDRP
jgi:hypothetical protein